MHTVHNNLDGCTVHQTKTMLVNSFPTIGQMVMAFFSNIILLKGQCHDKNCSAEFLVIWPLFIMGPDEVKGWKNKDKKPRDKQYVLPWKKYN